MAEGLSCDILDLTNLTPESLTGVLSYLPADFLINTCRLVCHQWKDIVDGNTLWRLKCLRERFYVPRLMGPPPADFKDYYFKNPYNRNLVKNPSGKGYETCWATSYGWCVKHQLIDLLKEGCTGAVLDQIKPDIYISEWTAARRDCGSTYKLHVQLLGEDKQEVLDQFSKQRHVEQWEGGHWEKIEHKFQNYPPGVRYIWYQHSGKDLQFWAGHYGPKLGGSTVRFQFREQTK
ncbi:F-box only protein 6 isoform X2 [Lingula anatina]|uniref:F-box only protein 6 isoform X2 n=1 Tax=Lingula anatina TaxID=7574 RepID=A0A1S3IBQ1_LINAN|nr:F-box only protein 6 isoform X2 [Lingula anatina]|eukprot:XP_013395682.1 F-box only protein 6 isoform X2 [Lingula anatina]